ncbi:MAG: ATP synthase F1 subunit epsilon [Filifactoraceae bacterium]
MSTFRLKVTTPDKIFYNDDVEEIIVRTTVGDTGIMSNHIDYVATLRVGRLLIKNGKDTREATISGGVLEVSNGLANIITTSAEWIEDIDIHRAEQAKKNAEEKLKSNLSKNEERIYEAALRRAVNRIGIKS